MKFLENFYLRNMKTFQASDIDCSIISFKCVSKLNLKHWFSKSYMKLKYTEWMITNRSIQEGFQKQYKSK